MRRGEEPLTKYKNAPGLTKPSSSSMSISSPTKQPSTPTRPKTSAGIMSNTRSPVKTPRRPKSAIIGTRTSESSIAEYSIRTPTSRSSTPVRPRTSIGIRSQSVTQTRTQRPQSASGTMRDRQASAVPGRLVRSASAVNVRASPVQYNNSYIPSTLSSETERRFKNLRKGNKLIEILIL
jgi:hypothetical protein